MTTTLTSPTIHYSTKYTTVSCLGAYASIMKLLVLSLVFALCTAANAEHHMKRHVELRPRASTNTPLVVTNNCAETIYPGIVTQGGTGSSSSGFQLTPGSQKSQTVSSDWQGRVWGRTNCSFNSQGTAQGGGVACQTGDCGGTVACQATVNTRSFAERHFCLRTAGTNASDFGRVHSQWRQQSDVL